jgi:biopolymer transport protein ExbB/TolQ
MTRPSSSSGQHPAGRSRRSWTNLAAFVVGVPLAVAVLALIQCGVLGGAEVQRYVSHPVENVEVLLFCCALGALGAKFWSCRTERAACRAELLPPWTGEPVGVAEAGKLRAKLSQLARPLQNTYMVRRVAAILDFIRSRGSANELDDQLRTLADNDAIALETSYSLVRFITWAIPILGFLGTVLGITASISGVTPEKLEHSLSEVTDGLALAFDATALALGLTMITMFLSFLVDRSEQAVVEAVDRYADEQLAHRFERMAGEGSEFIQVVRQNTNVLVKATGQLVQKQAEVWAKSLAEAEKRWAENGQRQFEQVAKVLETVLERTLEAHAKRLADLEKQVVEQSTDLLERLAVFATALRDSGREQQATLVKVVESVTAQAEALAHLQDGEVQLLKLQEVLAQNLSTLAGAGAFEQAVHSLTGAIHLLTARVVPLPTGGTSRIGQRPERPGAAA